MVFNIETLEVFKRDIYKKIMESSLHEEMSLSRNPSNNRRLTFHCTNSSSDLSIRCCTCTFTFVFINRLRL